MNAGEALSLFLDRVGDPNGDRVGPAGAMLLIDQGVIAVNREAKLLRTDGALLVADAARSPAYAYYTRPADLFEVDCVEYLGNPLPYRTESQMRRLFTDWRTTSGTPECHLLDETHIRLAPYSTDALVVYCSYIRAPIATATNNAIDLPAHYELAAISWAAAEWLLQNNDRRETDTTRSLIAEYALIVGQASAYAATRGSKGPRRVGTRRP